MIVEIGALVGIIKGLLEATKTGRELFGGNSRRVTTDSVKKAQERLAGIADQLNQSVALSKMLPLWVYQYEQTGIYAATHSDDDLREFARKVDRLISDSIYDTFSNAFFRMNFAILPGVDPIIGDFRKKLTTLHADVRRIAPWDSADAWRKELPTLMVRMGDLREEVTKLTDLVEGVHAALIKELKDTASLVVGE